MEILDVLFVNKTKKEIFWRSTFLFSPVNQTKVYITQI